MKLSQWAKQQGLTYKGAWRMWKAGQLPVPAEQLPTGTIIVKEIKAPAHAVGLYARVSSSEQRKDLEAQLGRLVVFAHHHRVTMVEAVSEVGSGLRGHRPSSANSWPIPRFRRSWSSMVSGSCVSAPSMSRPPLQPR